MTNSALTTHGNLQALRLGTHLSTPPLSLKITHIFSSDLQRAVLTADAILAAQRQHNSTSSKGLEVKKLELLREKHFGFYEGKTYFQRPKDPEKRKVGGREAYHERERPDLKLEGFQEEESRESMQRRMDRFLDEDLHDVVVKAGDEETVVVVAHGIILLHLWRCILSRFPAANVAISPSAGMVGNGYGLEYLGAWSNTGWWELVIERLILSAEDDDAEPAANISSASNVAGVNQASTETMYPRRFQHFSLVVTAVNCTDHLKGFKKTGGGLGNVKHDSKQKTMDSFFVAKKRKIW